MSDDKTPNLFLASIHAQSTARYAAMAARSETFNGLSINLENTKGDWYLWVESDMEEMLKNFKKLATELGYEITSKLGENK